jgi:hypothetical protein
MIALAYLAIFAGALVLIAGLSGSSVTSVARGAPDRSKAGGPVESESPAGVTGEVEAGLTPGAGLEGLLPKGAKIIAMKRKDQGRDVQLEPGQQLLATGNFEVVRVASDPSGFGPDYPILRMLTGPFAGHDVYYGHTDATVHTGQRGHAGQVVAVTSKTGHNAPPGWLEFGYAPSGTPGPFGQPTPF